MKFAELVNALENIGVDSADSEAELILSHLFGASRASIVFDREKEYDGEKIVQILEKRAQRIPLQHILGKYTDFLILNYLNIKFILLKEVEG